MLRNTIKKKLFELNKNIERKQEYNKDIIRDLRKDEKQAHETQAHEEQAHETQAHEEQAHETQAHEHETQTEEENVTETVDSEETMTTADIYTHYADILNKSPPPKHYTTMNVCVYKINTHELCPFTMFLLYKNAENVLNFVEMDYKGSNSVKYVLEQFNQIFEDWNATIEYQGFIEDNDKLILVLKYTELSGTDAYIPPLCKYDSKWWWVLATEIINYKHVLNFNVGEFATKFLLNNYKLCILYDSDDKSYDIPDVGYFGDYYKVIVAVITLGLNRRGIYSSCGPYYYFTTYKGAMRNANFSYRFKKEKTAEYSKSYLNTIDENGRNKQGGIVKFALFLKKNKMLLGREFDLPDDSLVSLELASKDEIINSLLKIRDNSAKWVEHYNSIRVGSSYVELKDKPSFYTDPMITLKDYDQQTPLEYYYVDTTQEVDRNQMDKVNIM